MSTINTNGIDVNYPIPGQNNSTQGFRNNFTAIKTNLNTAGSEITDLQNKVVLKSALANTVLNNDMANTLIANASTLQFRSTTYNLGNALVGDVLVDCSLGDVQYGNLAGNITVNFGSWAPTDTLSTVKLQLGRPNNQANYTVQFTANAQINQDSGWTLLENSGENDGCATLTFPTDTTQLNLTVTSTDCGDTLFVVPTNRPFKTTQVQQRTPLPTGFLGDVAGTVAADANYFYVCTNNYNATTTTKNAAGLATTGNITLSGVAITGTAGQFSCTAASQTLVIGQPVTISGTNAGTGTITGYSNPTTYYIIATNGTTTFTLSATLGGPAITTIAGTTTGLTFTVACNFISLTNVTGVSLNMPVIFDTMYINGTSVTSFGNITSGTGYYVKSITGTSITISDTRSDGNAGPTLNLTTVEANAGQTYMDATFYSGSNIWKRIPLTAW
jgi:hypothetical protein